MFFLCVSMILAYAHSPSCALNTPSATACVTARNRLLQPLRRVLGKACTLTAFSAEGRSTGISRSMHKRIAVGSHFQRPRLDLLDDFFSVAFKAAI